MRQTIEGGYIGNIKITNLNKKTKKISNNFSNALYKISNLDEFQILVEITGLDKHVNEVMIFFEDSYGYSSSNLLGRIDRIFFNKNNILVHSWSSNTNLTNSDEIASNGYVQLEKSCFKCKN